MMKKYFGFNTNWWQNIGSDSSFDLLQENLCCLFAGEIEASLLFVYLDLIVFHFYPEAFFFLSRSWKL